MRVILTDGSVVLLPTATRIKEDGDWLYITRLSKGNPDPIKRDEFFTLASFRIASVAAVITSKVPEDNILVVTPSGKSRVLEPEQI